MVKGISSTNSAGTTECLICKRINLNSYLIPHKIINEKWITDQNLGGKTIKSLQENTGGNLCDLGLCNGFTDMTLKAHQ